MGSIVPPSTAKFYDYIPLHRSRPDVAFYVEISKESMGPALELGCGTGRILIPVARAGIKVLVKK